MKHLLLVAALVLAPACQTADVATPQEAADRAVAVEAGDQAAVDTIDRGIAERVVGEAVALVDPYVPVPLRPFIPLLGALFFRRPRRLLAQAAKEVGSAAKNLVTGKPGAAGSDVGSAIESMLQTVGLADSRNDTIDDLLEFEAELRTAGKVVAADTVAEKIAELIA